MALNSWYFCFYLWSAGIIGMQSHSRALYILESNCISNYKESWNEGAEFQSQLGLQCKMLQLYDGEKLEGKKWRVDLIKTNNKQTNKQTASLTSLRILKTFGSKFWPPQLFLSDSCISNYSLCVICSLCHLLYGYSVRVCLHDSHILL